MWLSSRRRARPTPGCRSPRSHVTHRSPIGLPRITDVLHLAVTIKPAFERFFRGQYMWKIVNGVRAAALLVIFSLAWIPLKGFAQISLPCVPGVTCPNPDTTPPTVSITSPSSGATVSGTITVTANASDNVGVAGVQFKLDGANLGAEDTTAP